MSKENLRRSLRHASKEIRFGEDAACRNCGASDIRVLQWTDDEILCAEGRLDKQGKPRTENHHPVGRKNSPFTITMLANEHAILSDYQRDWPDVTLKNPKGDLLHRFASWQRLNRDSHTEQANESGFWADELEEFAAWLDDELGPDWWEKYQKCRNGGKSD